MFDSNLFNKYRLFQKFSGIYKKQVEFKPQVSEFLYCVNSAILRLLAVKEFEYDCIKEYNEREKHLTVINTSRIHFFSSRFVRLLNEIPVFFSDMRKAQNRFLKILSFELKLKINLPNSMYKAIKNTLEKYDIPTEISRKIYNYWDSTGKLVKDYRDIDQHWHQIVNKTWLQLEPEKKLIIILPDSKDEITYNKKVNALNFLESSFYEFHELVESISEILGYSEINNYPTEIPMDPPIFLGPQEKDFLFCLFVFDKGPISGAEFYYKHEKNSINIRMLPKSI